MCLSSMSKNIIIPKAVALTLLALDKLLYQNCLQYHVIYRRVRVRVLNWKF